MNNQVFKKTIPLLISIIILMLCILSCKKNQTKEESTQILVYNSEIDYLTALSNCNSDVIALTDKIRNYETNTELLKIVEAIRKNQIDIDSELKKIAYKKLILLTINPVQPEIVDYNNLLSKLIAAIKKEIRIFKEVRHNTSDKEMISFLDKSLLSIELELKKLENNQINIKP